MAVVSEYKNTNQERNRSLNAQEQLEALEVQGVTALTGYVTLTDGAGNEIALTDSQGNLLNA